MPVSGRALNPREPEDKRNRPRGGPRPVGQSAQRRKPAGASNKKNSAAGKKNTKKKSAQGRKAVNQAPVKKGSQRKAPPAKKSSAKKTAKGRGSTPKIPEAIKGLSVKGMIVRSVSSYYVLIPTSALLLLGLVMVFSAGSIIGIEQGVGGYKYFLTQLEWAGLGLVAMYFFARFDYHQLAKISFYGVVISVVMLVMVLFIGRGAYGAKRWLELGPISLQPTEIAKFTLLIYSAYILAMKGKKIKEFKHIFMPVLLITCVVAGLFLLQPDLGSAIVLCLSILVLIAVAEAQGKHVAMISGVGAAAAVFFMLSAPYRRARFFSFLDPWKTYRGSGYQVIQSYVALGSGNLKGLGLGMSRQKFSYLPNAHNDFIFSIIGEELGLVGTMTVVLLLLLLLYGGYRIATEAPDKIGRLVAFGITGLIIIQAIVNIGGVTGLMPITGVPLPLVSYGGSSLCVCMACIGILLNISAQGNSLKRR